MEIIIEHDDSFIFHIFETGSRGLDKYTTVVDISLVQSYTILGTYWSNVTSAYFYFIFMITFILIFEVQALFLLQVYNILQSPT